MVKRNKGAEKGGTVAKKDKMSSGTDDANVKNRGISNSEISLRNKRKSNAKDVVLTRPGRIIKSASRIGAKTVVDSERKEAPLSSEQVNNTTPSLNEQELEEEMPQVQPNRIVRVLNLEEKVEYLIQSFKGFKSKNVQRNSKTPSEVHTTDFSYKDLYIDSQKKIEDLTAENNHLLGELEFAHGKIEAYEKMKELVLVPSLQNYTKAPAPHTKPISPTAVGDQATSSVPKKKSYKKTRAD